MKDKPIRRLEDMEVYRLACELWDEFWEDSEILMRDPRGKHIAAQMTDSIGSIGANMEEGYGSSYGKELIHFLRISRGSARESKGWYWRARHLLPAEIVEKRMQTLDTIIAMLVKWIQAIGGT